MTYHPTNLPSLRAILSKRTRHYIYKIWKEDVSAERAFFDFGGSLTVSSHVQKFLVANKSE